jgi:hypothetical protein
MVFSSHIFLFYFLPIFLLVYYILPFTWKNFYLRNNWITISSYVFYGWLVPWYVIPMIASTIWDYLCGKIITTPGMAQWKRKAALLTAIIGDMVTLDGNHPLADKTLHFDVQVVSVREATSEELEHGHVHGAGGHHH